MLKKITVTASKTYEIIVSRNLLKNIGDYVKAEVGVGKAALVTDDKVDSLFGEKVATSLQDAGFVVEKFVIKNGEQSKNSENYLALLNFLAQNNFTRSDVIIALGGGVVGDLAGFAASTYLRGVRLVQVPTTLLAAVDSSVGGKTAINLDAGKNLAGSFYQPNLVLCDCDTFLTLEPDVFKDGCAEVIKYGIIADKNMLLNLKVRLQNDIDSIVTNCIKIKRDIVIKDEYDNGMRKLLNFGHTIGHAVEKNSNFAISHGKAVAIGMIIVSRAAKKLGHCSEQCYQQIYNIIKDFGFELTTEYSALQLYDFALSDKKRAGDSIDVVLPEELGRCVIKSFSVEQLFELINLGIKE